MITLALAYLLMLVVMNYYSGHFIAIVVGFENVVVVPIVANVVGFANVVVVPIVVGE